MKGRFFLFFVFCLTLIFNPINHAYAIELNGRIYDEHEYYSMRNFLYQPSALSGMTNAQALGWNPADPSTWWGVEWNDASPKRIKRIEFYFSVAGDLDVSDFSCLESLWCFGNKLKSINASGTVSLTDFLLDEKALEVLDLSGASALESVSCQYSRLNSLDVGGASALKYIYCNHNRLQSLDVSGLSQLKYLFCHNNQLQSLNLSGTEGLEWLECQNNQLTFLDVNQSPAVTNLYSRNNRLKQIEASFGVFQTSVEATGNGYVELAIENETAFVIAKPFPGAAFLGWSGYSQKTLSNTATLKLGEADYFLTADFSFWNVVFDKNGGDSDAAPSSISVYHESKIDSLPLSPALLEHSFAGWYKEAECENAWDFGSDSIISDTILFAKWVAKDQTDETIVSAMPSTPVIPDPTMPPVPANPSPTAVAEAPPSPTEKNMLFISPQNGIIYVGGRFFIEPSVAGGRWQYDSAYIFENGGVFTALKAGTTRITYIDGAQIAYADIAIHSASLPGTGQSFSLMWVLLVLGLCIGVLSLMIISHKKGTACLKNKAKK